MPIYGLSTRRASLLALSFAVSVHLLSSNSAAQPPKSFNDWFCETFRVPIVCEVLDVTDKLAAEDGCSQIGTQLRHYSLEDGVERTIWDCGACASPLPVADNDLAVIADAAIFRVRRDGSTEPAQWLQVPGERIVRLLAVWPEDPSRIAVVARAQGSEPRMAIANLATGQLEEWPAENGTPPALMNDCQLQRLHSIHSGRCLGIREADLEEDGFVLVLDRYLASLCESSAPIDWKTQSPVTSEPLELPEGNAARGLRRFDLIWSRDGHSVFSVVGAP